MTKSPELPVGLSNLMEMEQMLHDLASHGEYYNHGTFFLGGDCGTPACSLGWWAARHRDRWEVPDGLPVLKSITRSWNESRPVAESAMQEFEIDEEDAEDLFLMASPRTAEQQAKKVRRVIDQKLAALNPL